MYSFSVARFLVLTVGHDLRVTDSTPSDSGGAKEYKCDVLMMGDTLSTVAETRSQRSKIKDRLSMKGFGVG